MVSFRYVKKNGDTRNAVGTLNLRLIPLSSHPKGPLQPPPTGGGSQIEGATEKREEMVASPSRGRMEGAPGLIRYFDFTVQDWRSLYCDEVIEAKPLVLNPTDDYNDAVFEANLTAQGL
ncbi:MAG: DUF2693 domain-containing protein [Prevotella sp.]|nr:DUF2693 domain-containing protein [Prevotella sp.]